MEESVPGGGEDEEITVVLKQINSAASGREETRAPTWRCVGCSARGGKGGCFVGVECSRAAMLPARADRRVLCTLRDALPVWDVGKRRTES